MIEIIHIELTNQCQLSCSSCGDDGTRPVGKMELISFAMILDQLLVLNPLAAIRLFLSGDPLLHPHVAEFCALARALDLRDTTIHTNAYGLTEDLSKELVSSGIGTISFSLDKYHTTEENRGRLIGWAAAKNVKQFLNLNSAAGNPVHTIVQALVTSAEEARIYAKLFDQYFAQASDRVIKKPHSWDRVNSIPGASVRNNTGVCKFLRARAAIAWDGEALTCCADLNGRMSFGNVLSGEISLKEAVESAERLGNLMAEGKELPSEAPCRTCERYEN